MRRLYFLGGEDIAKRDSKEINLRAFVDAAGTPAVLVFNWSGELTDKGDKYRKIIVDYFSDLGARRVEFAELSDSLQEISEKINECDLIYLPGGNTILLIERIRKAKVDFLMRGCDKIIMGNSAGALVLAKNYVRTRAERKTDMGLGLGLVDFAIGVHYKGSDITSAGRFVDEKLGNLSERMKMAIYAIPERCALIYDNGSLSFMGNVCVFHEGKKKECR